MDRMEHSSVLQSEQSPTREEIHSMDDMNNDVKDKVEAITIPRSMEPLLQVLAGDFSMVETRPPKYTKKGNDEEGEITPSNSKDGVADRKRRNYGEIEAVVIENPPWLPETYATIVKYRKSGSTAGTKDKYYVEPKTGHHFRSRREVEHFEQTGEYLKSKGKLKGAESGNRGIGQSQQRQALIQKIMKRKRKAQVQEAQ